MSQIDLHCYGEPCSASAAVLLEHAVVRVAVGLHVGRGHLASADGTGYAQEGLVEFHGCRMAVLQYDMIIGDAELVVLHLVENRHPSGGGSVQNDDDL